MSVCVCVQKLPKQTISGSLEICRCCSLSSNLGEGACIFSGHKSTSQYGSLGCVTTKSTIYSRGHHLQPRPGSPWKGSVAVTQPEERGHARLRYPPLLQCFSSWQQKRLFQQGPSGSYQLLLRDSGPGYHAVGAGVGIGRWGTRIHNVAGVSAAGLPHCTSSPCPVLSALRRCRVRV